MKLENSEVSLSWQQPILKKGAYDEVLIDNYAYPLSDNAFYLTMGQARSNTLNCNL